MPQPWRVWPYQMEEIAPFWRAFGTGEDPGWLITAGNIYKGIARHYPVFHVSDTIATPILFLLLRLLPFRFWYL